MSPSLVEDFTGKAALVDGGDRGRARQADAHPPGGRDYQVTVADDLSGWRAGLAGRPGIEIRVHDACDHMFFPGSGPSTPAGYGRPQHVDAAVVAEVADWLGRDRA